MNPFIAKKAISDDDDEYWQMIEKLWNKLLKDENNKSEEAESLRQIIKNGELVNDDLIIKLTLSLFNSNKEAKGFIFDGVPRNISQYNIMRKTFNFQQSLIINCELNEDILIEKLTSRRVC